MSNRETLTAATTETAAAAALGAALAGSQDQVAFVPPDYRAINHETYEEHPRRKRSEAKFYDVAGFAGYLNEQREGPGEGLGLWADLTEQRWAAPDLTVTAVLNHHQGRVGVAGWGDFRAVLRMNPSLEWTAWAGLNGKALSQVEFCHFLEDWSHVIVQPKSAELLEVAADITVRRNAEFSAQVALAGGVQRIGYVDTARATAKGEIEVPRELTLHVRVWETGEPWNVRVRIRPEISDQHKLAFRLRMIEPETVLNRAVQAIVREIEEAVSRPVWRGKAPEALLAL